MAEVPVRFRGDARDALRASRQAVGAVNEFERATQRNTRTMMQASRGALAGSGAFRSLGRQIAFASSTFLGTAGFTAALAGALKLAGQFERQLNVFQEVAGATAKQMRQVSQLAKALGADITIPGASAADAADAMTQLAKGGLSVRDAMAAAKGTLQLAAAAELDNAEAANIAVSALNSFGLSGGNAIRIADLLAAASAAAQGEISDMAIGLRQSSAVANQMGLSASDTVTALTQLAKAGIEGSDAGTSLRTMLQRLVPQTDEAREQMAQLGVRFADAKGNLLPLRDMISQYSVALERLTPAQRASAIQTLFGTDAARAANIILAAGVQKHDEMRRAVERQGAAQDLSGAKTEGATGALEALISTVETAAIDYGTKLLPALNEGTRSLTKFIDETSRSPEVREFFQDAMEFSGEAARMMRDAAEAADEIADAIGGWDQAFTLILSGLLAKRLFRVAAGLGAIGTAAGTGPAGATTKVSGLRGALVGLGKLSAVAIGIDILINRNELQDWLDERGIGFLTKGVDLLSEPWKLSPLFWTGKGLTALQPLKSPPGPGKDRGAGATAAVFGPGAAAGLGSPFARGTPTRFGGGIAAHGSRGRGDWQSDRAADIHVAAGTPVLAVMGGTVTKVKYNPATTGPVYGDQVTIIGTDRNGYFYTHIRAQVRQGQKVGRGAVIGTVSPWAGDPHLHLGISPGGPNPEQALSWAAGRLKFPDLGARQTRETRKKRTDLQPDPYGDGDKDKPKPTSELLPRAIRLGIAEAEGKGPKKEVAALRRAEKWLEEALTRTKRNSEKRIEIQKELNATRDRIKSLQKGKEPGPFEIPLGLRTGLTRAEGTERLDDDVKWLGKIRDHLQSALKGSKGERRLDILEQLNRVRDQLRSALDLSKPLREARAKMKPELAALREQIARMPPELQAQLRPRLNALDRQLRNAVKTETVDAVGEKAEEIREAIVAAIEKAEEEVEDATDAMNDALGEVGDMAGEIFDAQTEEMVKNARKAYDVQTPAERELEALRALREEIQRGETLEDINERLGVARRLGDPSLIRKGEKELRLIELDEREAGLEARAEVEREANERLADEAEDRIRDERRSTRRGFEARLDETIKGLAKEGATYEEAMTRIQAVLDEFGITSVAAASLVGDYFKDDFVKAIDTAAAAFARLRKEIIDVQLLTGGTLPPEVLATIPGRGSRGAQPMQRGGHVKVSTHALLHPGETVVPPLESEPGKKAIRAFAEALGGPGAGRPLHVTVNVHGSLIHESQLEDVVHNALLRKNKRVRSLRLS